MPESIDQYFVQKYQNTITLLCQQRQSRLEGTTLPPVDIQGENLYWETMGPTEAVELVTRHDNTPNIEVDHGRRKGTATPYVWATLLDRIDKVRMLVDPMSSYNQSARFSMLRRKDRIILAALGGTSYSGKTGSTAVALPAAQKIAAGGVGLTIAKLLTAKEMLDEAEVDEEAPRYIVCAAAQITDLLNTTEVTNKDYNTVAALAEGKVNSFLGFQFIRTQLVTYTVADTTRWCYGYSKGAVGLGVLEEITSKLDQRADKNYSWQPYLSMDMGATRLEEVQVVEIACIET
jgi:hypothetical protein